MVVRWCVGVTLVLLGARQAGAFLAPSLVPQSLATQRRPSTACKLPQQLRTPLQRAGVSLAAKRGGILEENYVDPYVVLGVPKQATSADIKKAYRKLSQTYHPDVNAEKGAQEKFIMISQAYSVLGDEENRRRFDYSSKMGLADDFAERVSGFREAAGPEYREVADKAEELIENKWAVVAFSSFMPIVLLTTMSFAKDWLHDVMLGTR